MGNRINKPNPLDITAEQELSQSLAGAMVPISIKHNVIISGQCNLHFEAGAGDEFPCVYSSFPNGDFIVWFLYKGYYSVAALVNQKFKHLATFPVGEMAAFQEMIETIKSEIGKS